MYEPFHRSIQGVRGVPAYEIQPYTYEQAKKHNVVVKPSSNPKKKIDVFKDNKKIASIGATGYLDYPTYLKHDKQLAEQRRKLYKARHKNNIDSGNGYWANKLLW
jgi:hypothetical protein